MRNEDGQRKEREHCFSCTKDLCDSGTLLKVSFVLLNLKNDCKFQLLYTVIVYFSNAKCLFSYISEYTIVLAKATGFQLRKGMDCQNLAISKPALLVHDADKLSIHFKFHTFNCFNDQFFRIRFFQCDTL